MQKIVNFKQSLDYYLRLIDARCADGDYLGALDAGRRALDNAKTRIDRESINVLLGQIYYEMELYPLSCEHFFRAVRIPETRASAFFGIGRNLVKMHNPKLALEYFDATLSCGGTEDFSGAVLEWTYVLREELSEPENINPTLAIAKNLVKMKKFEQAIALLSPLALKDKEAEIYLADVLILNKEYDKAREIIFSILRENNDNAHAILVLCSLCCAENDLCSLEINLQKLAGIPLNFAQYVLAGNFFCAVGNYKEAVKKYAEAIALDEYNTKVLLFQAIAYFNLGETQEALYSLGRARWVDIENPVLNIYYDIFSRNLVEPPLAIITQIPAKIAENKLNNIFSALNGNFCESLHHSLLLADDVEWAMTFKDAVLTERLANALSKCKKKKALSMYRKFMLSVRLNKNQKFYLTKYALVNENFKIIDFTADYRYKSFKPKIPALIKSNETLKLGYINALCYAITNGIEVNFDKFAQKISKKCEFNANLGVFDEKLCACLYFCENAKVFNQACIYFGVEGSSALQVVNDFELLL